MLSLRNLLKLSWSLQHKTERGDKATPKQMLHSGADTVAWFYHGRVHLNIIKTQFVCKQHKTHLSPLIVRWDCSSWTFQFSALLKIITCVLFADEYRMSCWNNFKGRSLGTPCKHVYHDSRALSLSISCLLWALGSAGFRGARHTYYQQASCVNVVCICF